MRMHRSPWSVIAVVTLPAVFAVVYQSCVVAQATRHVSWSSSLNLKDTADIPARLRAPVTEGDQTTPVRLNLTNGTATREITSCKDYLNAIDAGFYAADNLMNKKTAAFVGRCYVLRDLQNAHAPVSGHAYSWTKQSLSELPPLLVAGERSVADKAEQADRQGKSWQQFDPTLKETAVTPDWLEATDGDYNYSLGILARGSFEGSGREEIAAYGCAAGQQSTWFECEYFIFAPGSDGKLTRLTDSSAPYKLKIRMPKTESSRSKK